MTIKRLYILIFYLFSLSLKIFILSKENYQLLSESSWGVIKNQDNMSFLENLNNLDFLTNIIEPSSYSSYYKSSFFYQNNQFIPFRQNKPAGKLIKAS